MSLTLTQAHLLSAFFAVSYVGSIYVLPGGRLGLGAANARRRDDPSVMRTRMLAVSVSTALSCVVVGFVASMSDPSGSTPEGELPDCLHASPY
jgi:prenyl protein peptidase